MGANFNADFNIGSVVVVISHGNNDHVGGLLGIESYIRIRKLISNRKDLSTKLPAQLCTYNKDWNWDGVEFRFLQSALEYSS